jgi:hypothetical protein
VANLGCKANPDYALLCTQWFVIDVVIKGTSCSFCTTQKAILKTLAFIKEMRKSMDLFLFFSQCSEASKPKQGLI